MRSVNSEENLSETSKHSQKAGNSQKKREFTLGEFKRRSPNNFLCFVILFYLCLLLALLASYISSNDNYFFPESNFLSTCVRREYTEHPFECYANEREVIEICFCREFIAKCSQKEKFVNLNKGQCQDDDPCCLPVVPEKCDERYCRKIQRVNYRDVLGTCWKIDLRFAKDNQTSYGVETSFSCSINNESCLNEIRTNYDKYVFQCWHDRDDINYISTNPNIDKKIKKKQIVSMIFNIIFVLAFVALAIYLVIFKEERRIARLRNMDQYDESETRPIDNSDDSDEESNRSDDGDPQSSEDDITYMSDEESFEKINPEKDV